MITTKELSNRIYDKLFDNVGTSKHHVELEENINIINQYIEGNKIYIELGDGSLFEVSINKK